MPPKVQKGSRRRNVDVESTAHYRMLSYREEDKALDVPICDAYVDASSTTKTVMTLNEMVRIGSSTWGFPRNHCQIIYVNANENHAEILTNPFHGVQGDLMTVDVEAVKWNPMGFVDKAAEEKGQSRHNVIFLRRFEKIALPQSEGSFLKIEELDRGSPTDVVIRFANPKAGVNGFFTAVLERSTDGDEKSREWSLVGNLKMEQGPCNSIITMQRKENISVAVVTMPKGMQNLKSTTETFYLDFMTADITIRSPAQYAAFRQPHLKQSTGGGPAPQTPKKAGLKVGQAWGGKAPKKANVKRDDGPGTRVKLPRPIPADKTSLSASTLSRKASDSLVNPMKRKKEIMTGTPEGGAGAGGSAPSTAPATPAIVQPAGSDVDDSEPWPSKLCTVCIEEPATVVFIPCGHVVTCNKGDCRSQVESKKRCPLCDRARTESYTLEEQLDTGRAPKCEGCGTKPARMMFTPCRCLKHCIDCSKEHNFCSRHGASGKLKIHFGAGTYD